MRSLPPWRLGAGGGIGWLFAALVFLYVWIFELEIWLTVWLFYGLFLAARWIWQHNPIGQTIDTAAAARERRQPAPYDPHGAPPTRIDLGRLDRQ